MTTLCKIENGIVVNRAHFDGAAPEDWLPEGETWVESEEAQIGWTYAGGEFTAPEPEPETQVTPTSISSRQGKIQLLRMGLMTAEEASAGTPPAFLTGIAGGMDPAEAAELLITWRDAAVWDRDNPLFGGSLLEAAAAALGQQATPEVVDQFFRDAAGI